MSTICTMIFVCSMMAIAIAVMMTTIPLINTPQIAKNLIRGQFDAHHTAYQITSLLLSKVETDVPRR
jgi:hypothetical protein